MPDCDISLESYSWLATDLAQAGMAVATYSWISEDKSRGVHIGPGLQRKRLAKKRFGKKPSCPALPAIFSELKRLNKKGLLEGHLNLSHVVLGGHAQGGALALLNANRDWFPGVCGAFSYAAHTLADPDQGWDDGDVLSLPPDMPLLMMAGTADGVLAADLPGDGDHPETWAVEQSFRKGLKGKRGDRHLVLIEDASHYTFASPRDKTSGRCFLDRRTRGQGKALRKYLSKLVVMFCDQTCRGNPMSAADLKALCDPAHPMVARSDLK